MAMDDILSRLRAKKLLDKQSNPPYPQSNFDMANLAGIGVAPDTWANIIRPETDQEMMRQMAQAQAQMNATQQGVAIYNPVLAQQQAVQQLPPNRPATGATISQRAREMFLKRMGGLRAEMTIATEDYLHCHIYGEKVYLFYCFAGRDGCVKEDIDLFPSDTLITQFRMVLAT